MRAGEREAGEDLREAGGVVGGRRGAMIAPDQKLREFVQTYRRGWP